jgi:hypothetical protein
MHYTTADLIQIQASHRAALQSAAGVALWLSHVATDPEWREEWSRMAGILSSPEPALEYVLQAALMVAQGRGDRILHTHPPPGVSLSRFVEDQS